MIVQAGGTSYVAALTKNGEFYLLDAANLGGTDPGNLVPPGGAELKVAQDGMSVRTAPAALHVRYRASLTFNANGAEGCPAGAGTSIMSVVLTEASPPVPKVAWCAGTSSQTSPIVTTSDGKNDALVWFVNGSSLVALDGDTGAVVVTATGQCNNVRQWTSPIAVKGRIVAGGDGSLCSWSVEVVNARVSPWRACASGGSTEAGARVRGGARSRSRDRMRARGPYRRGAWLS